VGVIFSGLCVAQYAKAAVLTAAVGVCVPVFCSIICQCGCAAWFDSTSAFVLRRFSWR